jgi:ribose transport system substrate-binding protein
VEEEASMVGWQRAVVALAATLATAIAVAACGGSSNSSSTGSGGGGSNSAAATTKSGGSSGSGCGSIPTQMAQDPDGVLAKLPKDVQDAYNLFPQPVHASTWADWKPKKSGPYSVYFSPGNISTPFIQDMLKEFGALKAKANDIKKFTTQDSNNSVQTQIQQIRQAIRQKYDVLVVLPLSPAADAPVLEAAGKAGIPVIAPLNSAANRYVIGIQGNVILEGASLAQGLVSVMGDNANVLEMQGIPGVQASDLIFKGARTVFQGCTNVKVVGQPVGQFVPSVAKAQTLQFLTSHPGKVDGAIQPGGMATGIIQAFAQTGRKVPPIADSGATPGALAYWKAHKGAYKGVALGLPPAQLAQATWNVAEGLLAGRGIKITDISQKPLMITDQNLDQWVESGWSLTTPIAYAPGPAGALLPPSYLDQFFAKPAK